MSPPKHIARRPWLLIFMVVSLASLSSERLLNAQDSPQNRGVVLESQRSEQRHALVIGNAKYNISPLKNPVHDAELMSTVLRELGFEVITLHNADQNTMRASIETFGQRLKRGGIGLFYFAGHGLQVDGRNFLVPVDAEIEHESEIDVKSVDLGRVLAKMGIAGNRLNLVILDACRNNPFASATRSLNKGLAFVNAPRGTLIAYATSPGAVASDGTGNNGVFTSALTRHMRAPGLPIERVFKAVRTDVRKETGGRQLPWESSSLEGEFYFIPSDTSSIAMEPRGADKDSNMQTSKPQAPSPTPRVEAPPGFVFIEAGSIMVGSPEDETGHREDEHKHLVTLTRSFFMQRTETTQAEWMSLMKTNPSTFRNCGLNCPIETISWLDAVAYLNMRSTVEGLPQCYQLEGCQGTPGLGDFTCQRASFIGLDCTGYRLPTESEWEYALRAERLKLYYGELSKIAWYRDNAKKRPHPVGQKMPNRWGLYDLLGNVSEWVNDWYGHHPTSPVIDPTGPLNGERRLCKGSGYGNKAEDVRPARRYPVPSNYKHGTLGMRAVRTVPGATRR